MKVHFEMPIRVSYIVKSMVWHTYGIPFSPSQNLSLLKYLNKKHIILETYCYFFLFLQMSRLSIKSK